MPRTKKTQPLRHPEKLKEKRKVKEKEQHLDASTMLGTSSRGRKHWL
jgi:hypothetical protein